LENFLSFFHNIDKIGGVMTTKLELNFIN